MKAALLLLALSGARAHAGLAVTANVNKTEAELNEQVVLSVVVSGDSATLPEPRLPSMPAFNVHSAGRSQNLTFVNGKVSSSVEYTYVLVPRFPGKAVIGPIAAGPGGPQTAPIEVSVLRSNQGRTPPAGRAQAPGRAPAPAQGGPPDLFVTAETDKTRPYVNEQVLLTVRFYAAVPLLGNAEWVPPDLQGFLSEDLPPAQPRQTTYQGRDYYVYELKSALYPAQSGRLTIGASTIRCQAQVDANVDPFAPDFFQRFFSQGVVSAQPRSLRSNALAIDVLPLPQEGKPAGFSGAVGRYRVSAEVDKNSAQVGDAVNLSVTLEGEGNLKALGEIALPEMPGLRAYETVSSLNLQKDSAGVRGSKVFRTVLVPKTSGSVRVPPVPFVYFDPGARRYERVETAPIELSVSPSAASASGRFLPSSAPSGITELSRDIRHLKGAGRASAAARAAGALRAAPLVHAVPAAFLLAGVLAAGRRGRLRRDPAGGRLRAALGRAQERLRAARAAPESRRAELAAQALSGYLADLLGVSASGLTLRQAQQLLAKRSLPPGHLERLRMLWEELELQRFAPPDRRGAHESGLVDGVLELVQAIEETLS